jgi:hypothetical protein
LTTATAREAVGEGSVRLAVPVSSVGETYVVEMVFPWTWMSEPFTKPVPLTVNEYGELAPPEEAESRLGSGLRMDSVRLPIEVGEATLTALMVTVLGLGITAGGV